MEESNYRAITLWLAGAPGQKPAVNDHHVIKWQQETPAQQQKILTCAADEIPDDVMHLAYLPGAVAVDDLGKLS